MNKETRQFIFGFILLVLCSIGLCISYEDLTTKSHEGIKLTASDFLLFGAQIYSLCVGAYYIIKNI